MGMGGEGGCGGRGRGVVVNGLEGGMEGKLGIRVWCCCKNWFLGLIQRDLLQKERGKKLRKLKLHCRF